MTREKVLAVLDKMLMDHARPALISWTIEQMSLSTGIKKEYLDKHVLKDPRMKQFERRNNGNGLRIWMYEGSFEALREILNEWD
ncbi:hypothetical protein ADM90_19500 [Lysinibacillus macroides]|uniref:Uncharacterized protein n=1 Tax=Lysinibacillus macroides TaxID=33935 RepID=A0A0M9DJK3_9BACI|nr:hypothetical protein ADM90_19500 [Lysinibacillus macroides]